MRMRYVEDGIGGNSRGEESLAAGAPDEFLQEEEGAISVRRADPPPCHASPIGKMLDQHRWQVADAGAVEPTHRSLEHRVQPVEGRIPWATRAAAPPAARFLVDPPDARTPKPVRDCPPGQDSECAASR